MKLHNIDKTNLKSIECHHGNYRVGQDGIVKFVYNTLNGRLCIEGLDQNNNLVVKIFEEEIISYSG